LYCSVEDGRKMHSYWTFPFTMVENIFASELMKIDALFELSPKTNSDVSILQISQDTSTFKLST
jgi:hypothetical protein